MKPATSFCRTRRLPGLRRSTNTSPPTASITARQIKRRLMTMRTQSPLRAPLPELSDEGEDTTSSHERQSSLPYRDGSVVVNSRTSETPIPPARVNMPELVCPLTLLGSIGAQPQRDLGGLHRLLHHAHHFVAESLQIRLVAEPRGERFEGLYGIVLVPVEAAVDEGLDASPQGVEQGRDRQRR